MTVTYLVSWYKVPHEKKDAHDYVFSNRHNVRPGDFENLDLFIYGRIQIHMIRADSSRDTDLEVFCLVEELY